MVCLLYCRAIYEIWQGGLVVWLLTVSFSSKSSLILEVRELGRDIQGLVHGLSWEEELSRGVSLVYNLTLYFLAY